PSWKSAVKARSPGWRILAGAPDDPGSAPPHQIPGVRYLDPSDRGSELNDQEAGAGDANRTVRTTGVIPTRRSSREGTRRSRRTPVDPLADSNCWSVGRTTTPTARDDHGHLS